MVIMSESDKYRRGKNRLEQVRFGLALGLSAKEIASELGIAVSTVSTYIRVLSSGGDYPMLAEKRRWEGK